MKAKSIKGTSAEEISKKLVESMADGFKPTLAIVFISIKQDIKTICNLLDKEGIEVFGATTAGEFIDSEIEEGSITIMLLDINRSYFKIVIEKYAESNIRETSRSIGETGMETFSQPAFIIASEGLFTDGTLIVNGIEDAAGPNATVFGGMAGDDLTATGTFVFNNKVITKNGLIALIIDKNKVNIAGLAVAGWQPVGTVHTVTKSEGLMVYTIDNEPALDIIRKFMGLSFEAAGEGMIFNYNLGDFFPIQLLRDNEPYVLREVRAVNSKDHSIMYSGVVPQGSKIRFSLPPDFDIIDKIKSDCIRLQKEQQAEAEAMIMFSCPSRRVTFGPMITEEIEGVKNVWDSPLIGFCTYGEIGKTITGKTEFHNNTCCVVTLKEK